MNKFHYHLLTSAFAFFVAIFYFEHANAETSPVSNTCDFSLIDMGPLALEGQDTSNPDRIFINGKYVFEKGRSENIDGKLKTSINIKEVLEIGFYRNWLAESVQGLGGQVRSSLSDSCTNSLGATTSNLTSYVPATFLVSQTVTKRQCQSADIPCGLPETTCTDGSPGSLPTCDLPSCDWGGCHGGGCHGGSPPQVPVCRTTTKMCRGETSVDIVNATSRYEFQLPLSFSGKVPSQEIKVGIIQTYNDLEKSEGEILKLFTNIGLTNALFGDLTSKYKNNAQEYINNILKEPLRSFNVPSADFVYLPEIRKNEDVKWIVPSKSPVGAAPFGISITRDSSLITSAACKVAKCLRDSQKSGVLLIKSCSLS